MREEKLKREGKDEDDLMKVIFVINLCLDDDHYNCCFKKEGKG